VEREAGDASLGKQTLCQLSYSRSGGRHSNSVQTPVNASIRVDVKATWVGLAVPPLTAAPIFSDAGIARFRDRQAQLGLLRGLGGKGPKFLPGARRHDV
jgi:hypothetical protein